MPADLLVVIGREGIPGEVAREEEVDELVAEARRREEAAYGGDLAGGEARLLAQLARGGRPGLLARLARAGRHLEQIAAGGEAVLPDQDPPLLVVERDDRDRPGVPDDDALRLATPREPDPRSLDGDGRGLEQPLRGEHRRAVRVGAVPGRRAGAHASGPEASGASSRSSTSAISSQPGNFGQR